MSKIKVGIIGCGTMGGEIARACQDRLSRKFELFAICDLDEKKAVDLNNNLNKKTLIFFISNLLAQQVHTSPSDRAG